MKTWIALFRGINVGSTRSVPMQDLATLLGKNGCVEVQTYIQSGNVVFRSPLTSAAAVARLLAGIVAQRHGFEPRVVALTRGELEKAASNNPFPQADANPKSLHLFFLADKPGTPALEKMAALKAQSESFVLAGKVLYLYTPDGFGKSKLAERTERLLGVDATARNWRTVTTLVGMARAYR
jgi:uncharacterized protein (DUF1697 family)